MSLTEALVKRPPEYAFGLWGTLTEEEQAQLRRWNHTAADSPQIRTHELFEQQVDRDPGGITIIFGQRHLSYRGLNERANQVAPDGREEFNL